MTRKARQLHVVPDTAEGAVLYIRQSVTRKVKDKRTGRTTSQLDTVSPELQEAAGRDYCQRQGLRVVAIVTDLNRTGRTLKRRKVQEAIDYLERDAARVIVVWKWSRLARNRRDFAVTCDYIENKVGGRVESSTEPIDVTTAVGRLNRGMLAEFAAFESDRAAEISREVIAARVADGLPGTGRPRFGYVNVGKGRFEPHPELSLILADMYRRYLSGTGYKGIARWLNDHGHPNNAGGHWDEGNVRSVLDSGFGAGRIRHNETYAEGVHDPVIGAEEWERYLQLREERTRLPARTKGSTYLLAGLLKCGLCGASMNARMERYGHVWYRCRNRGLTECPNPYVKLVAVEAEVLRWLRGMVEGVDAAARTQRQAQAKVVTHRHRAESLARLIRQQEEALTRLTVDRARGLIPDDDAYLKARDEITLARDRLTGEHEDVTRVAKAGARFDPAAYRGLLAEWTTTPVAARRETLRSLLARVRVWGEPFEVQPVPVWQDDEIDTTSRPRPDLLPRKQWITKLRAFTDEQAAEVRARHAAGESQRALSLAYGVGISTIHHLVHGRTYRTGSGGT